jgi:tyrosyl-tRNA synthetase
MTKSSSEGLSAQIIAEATELARAAEILPGGVIGLAKKLAAAKAAGRPLRVKLGIDPTSPHLHLGHSVVLRALRRFQERGHQVVLIIGSFTAEIGDPTGRNQTRPELSTEQVEANAETFLAQAGRVIDASKLEVHRNGDWFDRMTVREWLKRARHVTLNQLLAKEGLGARLEAGSPVAIAEGVYPTLQGLDSVEVKADIEIGGTDQLFNLQMGRKLQPGHGQEAQLAFMLPILEGTDGVRKMSKTFDNAIALDDTPDDMFAKCMRIPDGIIAKFFELATSATDEEVRQFKELLGGEGFNPKDGKEFLGHRVVQDMHGKELADAAQAAWRRVHSQRLVPDTMPEHVITAASGLVTVMVAAGLAGSNSKARQLIESGAVKLIEAGQDDGEKVTDLKATLTPADGGKALKVGRRFVRLILA